MDLNFDELKEEVTKPQDVSDMFSEEDIKQHKIFAVLACFPILFWLPLAVCSSSSYGKFYAGQGLGLLIAGIVLGILSGIISAILGLIPILGAVLSTIISLVINLVTFAAFLLIFISALQGKARYIPIIGEKCNFFK